MIAVECLVCEEETDVPSDSMWLPAEPTFGDRVTRPCANCLTHGDPYLAPHAIYATVAGER